MFVDNKTVVDSSTTPHAKLHKRHSALSFHCVREAVAAKIVAIYHLAGEYNPADILWRILQPLLFYQGNTADLYDD
jgi:hypothetical protein